VYELNKVYDVRNLLLRFISLRLFIAMRQTLLVKSKADQPVFPSPEGKDWIEINF
jgi:hypothetical protein